MEKRVGAFSQIVSKVFLSQSIGIRGTLFGGVKWYVCMYQSSVSCSPRMDCESSNVLLSRKTVLRWRRPCPLVSSEHWPLLWYRVPWQVTQVLSWKQGCYSNISFTVTVLNLISLMNWVSMYQLEYKMRMAPSSHSWSYSSHLYSLSV